MNISVAIPFHRLDHMFTLAVESCIVDLNEQDELLLVNDSSFSTVQVLAELQAALVGAKACVRIVENSGRGIVDARNTILSTASHEYISFLDSDDIWVSGRRDRHLELLGKNPEAPGVGSNVVYCCKHGTILGKSRLEMHPIHQLVSPLLEHFPRLRTSAVTIRSSLARSVGGFLTDESDCEDFGLWLRLQTHGQMFLIDKEIGAKYTIHSSQVSNEIGDKALKTLRTLTLNSLERVVSIHSFTRGLEQSIHSLKNFGLLHMALIGGPMSVRQGIQDMRNPRLLVLMHYLLSTSRTYRQRTCSSCNGGEQGE